METKITGTVNNVIYYNEENYYAIISLNINTQDIKMAHLRDKLLSRTLTVLCYVDRKPIFGEEFVFTGEFITNRYGLQFKADKFERLTERTLGGVIAFLSSDLFPGIGKVTATKIYQTLGPECLNLIEKDRSVLDKVPGMNAKQKATVYENIVRHESNRRALVDLLNFGLTMRASLNLIKKLGFDAAERIRENPYSLIDLAEGFGFKRADKIAMAMGISADNEIRIRALIRYVINSHFFASGDVYINDKELYQKISADLRQSYTFDDLKRILRFLAETKKIHYDEKSGDVYEITLYRAETILAEKVRQFFNRETKNDYNNNDIIMTLNEVMKKNNIKYTEKQKEAITTALAESFVIITGGPGTGKSTIIKAIIDSFELLLPEADIKGKIALLAPTGKAAKRLRDLTGHGAVTIHKYLGYEGGSFYRHGPNNPVDAKIAIVDEFSMVDVTLASRLFSALENDARVILVGDADQLPSVSPGDVLQDLILSEKIPTVRLDKIHRQAESSHIVSLAHAVNQGMVPHNIVRDKIFFRVPDERVIETACGIVEKALSRGMDLVRDIQILVPMYKGPLGINAINAAMQERFNPAREGEIKHYNRVFRVNDKVIQLVNRSEKNVMNGDVGRVVGLKKEDDKYAGVTVLFDVGKVDYSLDELEDLAHAYAISIHKAQGSEFDLVIVLFSNQHYIMLKRKLIYTSITRAKKYLLMLGNIQSLYYGVKRIEPKRKTKLVERINAEDEFVMTDDFDDSEMVNLSPYDFLDLEK
ncbi:MAG: ATP-dependent RecD-like DNA helicase [Bacillota bacterium]|mgnify:CR=1 FL=1|jgi:exodeoxyribonuclease V alpha subunit|nr:ATP-dependent RecD-like DNA helicase [Bacillota bacterium]HOA77866.1 ATP-dependent RecD-like DNA helicase [Bacilli bacterium]HPZ26694.1 ATP-dependent RecD-like DNA helicase [Bacilli bacterium]HQC88900.1 ATP-dependent RecD-like DNA helicase [Bacilli bacterium]